MLSWSSDIIKPSLNIFNANPHLLNLKNGVFDINKHKFISKHNKEYYFTLQLPIEFNPDAKCEKFISFVTEIMQNNKSLILLIQELMGYILLPQLIFHKLFLFHGSGNNGKNVLMHTIGNMLGKDLIQNVSIDALSNEYNRASLFGKLLNYDSELNTTKQLDSSWIKRIASGDPVQARQIYGTPFTFAKI